MTTDISMTLLPDTDYMEITCLDTNTVFHTRKSLFYRGFAKPNNSVLPSNLIFQKTEPIRFIIGILHNIPLYAYMLSYSDIVEVYDICNKYFFVENLKQYLEKYFIESKQYINILKNDITDIDFFYVNFHKSKLFELVDNFVYQNIDMLTEHIFYTKYYEYSLIQKKTIILFALKHYKIIDNYIASIKDISILRNFLVPYYLNNLLYDRCCELYSKENIDLIYRTPICLYPPDSIYDNIYIFSHLVSFDPLNITINTAIGESYSDSEGYLLKLFTDKTIPSSVTFYSDKPINLIVKSIRKYEIGTNLYRIVYDNIDMMDKIPDNMIIYSLNKLPPRFLT